ncbi:hypothetical protein CYMTET_38168 [Cymbomonas tetramitiformis]|uniref:Uncharacterized protein n=1 Tax=Cymbomonas tetramitiformis TaxID=36881 RepID=A0AAE0F5R3_9CHLO|nr:hypothetical protein CYMTET_38168 [Cymbomonas tetramitiformis]
MGESRGLEGGGTAPEQVKHLVEQWASGLMAMSERAARLLRGEVGTVGAHGEDLGRGVNGEVVGGLDTLLLRAWGCILAIVTTLLVLQQDKMWHAIQVLPPQRCQSRRVAWRTAAVL